MSVPEDVRDFASRTRAQEVHVSWLTSPITLEQAEPKHMVDFGVGGDTSEAGQHVRAARLQFARARGVLLTGEPVPFGFANRQRREMVAEMQDGDELWEFNSPKHFWEHMAGRAGIALVRAANTVDGIVTTMNGD